MRDIKVTYNHIQNIRSRCQTILKDLEKRSILNSEIADEIRSAKSLDELDFLVNPIPGSKHQEYIIIRIILNLVYAIQN